MAKCACTSTHTQSHDNDSKFPKDDHSWIGKKLQIGRVKKKEGREEEGNVSERGEGRGKHEGETGH